MSINMVEMISDNDNTPILITWGYDMGTGKIYFDTFLYLEENPEYVKHIFTRAFYQKVNVALFRIQKSIERKDIQHWVESATEEVVEKLKKAEVRHVEDVLRKREDNNAAEYIKHFLR